MKRARAEVSHDRCVGVAMCVQVAAKSFKLNAAGQADYRPDGEPDRDDLEDAADACPMSAITVTVQDVDELSPDQPGQTGERRHISEAAHGPVSEVIYVDGGFTAVSR